MTDPAVLNSDVYLIGCKRAQGKFKRLKLAFGFGRSHGAYVNCFHSELDAVVFLSCHHHLPPLYIPPMRCLNDRYA